MLTRRAVTFGGRVLIMQVGNLLAYDSVGQTTHLGLRLNTLMPVVSAHNGRRINILLPCARESSRKTVCYSGCLTKIYATAMIFRVSYPAYLCPSPTVIFRLDIWLGIDKQTNRQNSGRRSVILISNHFRQQKRRAALDCVCLDNITNVYKDMRRRFRFNDNCSDGFATWPFFSDNILILDHPCN